MIQDVVVMVEVNCKLELEQRIDRIGSELVSEF